MFDGVIADHDDRAAASSDHLPLRGLKRMTISVIIRRYPVLLLILNDVDIYSL